MRSTQQKDLTAHPASTLSIISEAIIHPTR
jgi:hypothetical protein